MRARPHPTAITTMVTAITGTAAYSGTATYSAVRPPRQLCGIGRY